MSTMQKVKTLRNLEGQRIQCMTAALDAMAKNDKLSELVAKGELVIVTSKMREIGRETA